MVPIGRRGGGGISAVDVRGFEGSGFERAAREDDDAVGADTRVDRWRVTGFAGVSFFSGAEAFTALTFRVSGGAGFLGGAVGRADRLVVLLEALEAVDSGEGSKRRTLSEEEFKFAEMPERGRDGGGSSETSFEVFSLFCGDCPSRVL